MQVPVNRPLVPLGLVAGGLCLFLACINTHGVDKGVFNVTLLLGCGAAIGAARIAVRACRCRGKVGGGETGSTAAGLELVGGSMAVFGVLLTYGLRSMEEADGRNLHVLNQAKILANAVLGHERGHGRLPPAAVSSKDGRPLLSWRVLILPYLDEPSGRCLFEEFKLDEPWDSPHNVRLLEQMPEEYAPPKGSTPQPFSTYFQVFVGPGTAFEGPEGATFADFPDHGAKTVLLVEAAEAVPWTKPHDLTYAADEPLPGLGHMSRLRFTAAFVDGHVDRLSTDRAEADLRPLITRNGGERGGPKPDKTP